MKKLTVFGLPLNPQHLLEQLKGASFCISYAHRDKLGKQTDQAIELVGQDGILLVDNGAFTAWQAGTDTMNDEGYIEGYAEWANDILDRCPQAIAVYPDKIDGTHEQNWQLICETMTLLDPERTMAIWHMHEPIEYLLHLCEGFTHIGIGSSAEYAEIVGSPKWAGRITEALGAIDAWEAEGQGAYIRPRIHMMRAQAQAHRFPFDSSDSTNVGQNHNRWRKSNPGENHVARMGRRLDAKLQASCDGIDAEHQEKRPLLDHVASSNLRVIWLLEQQGYVIPRQDDIEDWLRRYHAGEDEEDVA